MTEERGLTREDVASLTEDLRLARHDGIDDGVVNVEVPSLRRLLVWREAADAAMRAVLDAEHESVVNVCAATEDRLSDAIDRLRGLLLEEQR